MCKEIEELTNNVAKKSMQSSAFWPQKQCSRLALMKTP